MARRQHITLMLVGVMFFLGMTYFLSSPNTRRIPDEPWSNSHGSKGASGGGTGNSAGGGESKVDLGGGVPDSILKGGSIAPKLENATAKAELGRASWKLFHTMMARFPEEPTKDDSLALKTYIQLFARLYPCGDCASHFQKLLAKYPPQVSSRNAAAGWACFVHNEVNMRLKKEIFDCNKIGDFYDCGCGEEEKKDKKGSGSGQKEVEGREGVSIESEEGLTRGG